MRLLRRRTAAAGEEGFSLVEVVVALGLVAVVATAALGALTGGLRSTADLQRGQVAVGLANAALETARARPSVDAGGTNPLVVGRTELLSRWAPTLEAQVPDLADTLPLWDPAPATAALAAPALPVTTTSTVGRTTYTTTTYVGVCFRVRAAASGTCTRQGFTAVPPLTATPAGSVRQLRVVAVVRWASAGPDGCGGQPCLYSASTLLDPTSDPLWNTRDILIARDDTADLPLLTPSVAVNVLANDTVASSLRTVEVLSQPVTTSLVSVSVPGLVSVGGTTSFGTATAGPDGTITFARPGLTVSVLVEARFTYRVVSASGYASDPATVTVRVLV